MALLHVGGLVGGLGSAIEELWFQTNRKAASGHVVVVGVDRTSLERLGPKAFDPAYRALVLEKVLSVGPKRVFFDFGTTYITNEQTAHHLERTLEHYGRDQVAFPVYSLERPSQQGWQTVDAAPHKRFQRSVTLAPVNVTLDPDGRARTIALDQRWRGRSLPSAPAWLVGEDKIKPLDLRVDFGIDLQTIPHIGFSDIVEGAFDPSVLKNALVVIGATDLILGDQLSVPRYTLLSGAEFLAMATETLLCNHHRTSLPFTFDAALSLIIAVLAAAWLHNATYHRIAATWAIGMSVAGVAGFFVWSHGNAVPPLAGVWLALTLAALTAVVGRAGLLSTLIRRAEDVLEDQTALTDRLLETSRDAVLTFDPAGQIISVNSAARNLALASPGGDLGDYLPEARGQIMDACAEGLTGLIQSTLEVDGADALPVEIVFNAAPKEDGWLGFIALRDISERKAQEAKLKHIATHDELTGLANRRHLDTALARRIEQSQALQEAGAMARFGLLFVDLDHFKEINDTLGHAVGDEILKEVGRRLSACVSDVDVVARLGGDEFAVLLAGAAGHDKILAVAQTLRRAISSEYQIADLTLDIEASAGVALFPDHAVTAERLMQHADVAMYEAKRHHAGVALYDPEHDDISVRRLTLKGELRRAIEEDELTLVYQPKIATRDDALEACEALVRWRHPERGLISPGEFIPIAEQSGLIGPLTLWTLDEALAQHERWSANGFELPVSINLSARLLHDANVMRQFRRKVAASRTKPKDLVIEITESAVMSSAEDAILMLRQLAEDGFILSLDDFGAGYSSFDYLRRLPVHELKIDRAFVAAREQDPAAGEILEAMVGLGHRLGLRVVCEGVEDGETYLWLARIGCDIVQGYFTGRPGPPEALEQWPIGSDFEGAEATRQSA
ncbi:MAG: EAL domain-containing protein [Geminicoccaceae bacterium]